MIRRYDLRCSFEFIGKPSWRSMWNRSGKAASDQAWCQNKTGLVYAVIEGKDIVTRETIRLVECSGDKFANFEWLAQATIPMGAIHGAITVPGINIGLVLVTSNERITVTQDGNISVEARSEEDKRFHYAGYGR